MGRRILAAGAAVLALAGLASCDSKAAPARAVPSATGLVPPRAADNWGGGAIGADLVVGDQLRPLGGTSITLQGLGEVYSARRVADGWLVERGDQAARKLWLVTATTQALLVDVVDNGYAVAPDGRHIAFQQGNWLSVGQLTGGRLTVDSKTQLPGKDGPQGRTGATLAGWFGPYLAIGDRLGADYDGFDVYDPTHGGYNPTFNPDVYGVFGLQPGGMLLGAVAVGGDRHPCLATLDPAERLRASNVNCAVQVHPAHGWLAPDLRHLAGLAKDTVTVYEIPTGSRIASAPYQGTGEPVWLDRNVLLVPEPDRIVRIDMTDPKHPQDLPLPDPHGHWVVVPRAGS